jgi:signal transduction histidine kinase
VNVSHRIAARTEAISNLILGLVLAAVLAADTAVTAARHDNWPFELAVGAVVCALALFRGRNRVWAATAGLAVCGAACAASDVARLPSQPGAAAMLGLLVLGAAGVRVAATLPAALVALAGTAVLVAGRVTLRGEYIVAFALLGVLAWGGALAIGVWLRLLDIRRRLAIDAARRGERLELARELHDVVAHHIAGIVVQAQAARIVAAKRPGAFDATLADIESAGSDALAAMRQVVSLLRDPGDAVGVTPGPEQLSDLVSRFASHGLAVQLHLPDGDWLPWPPEVGATVYRIVQEALTNVVLHAPDATTVTVTVGDGRSGVTVEVTDDAPRRTLSGGRWFAPGGGHGLIGMRERAEALGGCLRAGPGPDGGWVVTAELPLPPGGTREHPGPARRRPGDDPQRTAVDP